VELLVERLRVVSRQIRRCHQRLDALCDAQTPESDGEESIPGEQNEERDVEILRSLPVPAGSGGWWSCAAPATPGCAMLRTGALYDPARRCTAPQRSAA